MSTAALAWSQFRFERRNFWRNPSAAFFNFLLPILLLVLIATAFASESDELEVLIPGVAGMGVLATTFTALAFNLTILRDEGVLKRIRGTPIPAGFPLARGMNANPEGGELVGPDPAVEGAPVVDVCGTQVWAPDLVVERLAQDGHGLWAEPDAAPGAPLALGDEGPGVFALQAGLTRLGYDSAPSGRYDAHTQAIVKAFQRHWRPEGVDGIADGETRARLVRLLRMAAEE